MTMPIYTPEIDYYGAGPDQPRLSPVEAAFIGDDEMLILKKLRSQLLKHSKRNKEKQNYYEAKQVIKHLDIAVPRTLTDIGTALSWAGTVVDILDERIDWLGWTTDSGDVNGLDLVYADNDLGVESNYAHVDSLTT